MYLTAALLLRSGKYDASQVEHRHGWLTLALLRDIIDAEYDLQYNAGRMAIMGGALGLVKDGSGMLRTTLLDGRAAIPFWTHGMSSGDMSKAERQQAIDRYNRLYKPALDAMNAHAVKDEGTTMPSVKSDGTPRAPSRVT